METPQEKEAQKMQEDGKSSTRGNKPFVFVSHDTRDALLADEFGKLLSNVSMGLLKSFRSSDKRGKQGIAYGLEWYQEIMKRLDEASDVVCLLTNNSINRPWLLYEAGVARGKLNTPVLGIALGIPLNNANNGPFAQFQNCGDSVDELTKLVVQLSERIPGADPPTDIIRSQVETFKKTAEEILSKQPEQENLEGMVEDTSVAKLFEEVKIMFQDLPQRIDRNFDPERKRRRLRFHPKMMHEMMFMSEKSEDKYLDFLILISMFRDDLPWIYEVGKETYETLKSSKADSTKEKAISSFRHIVKHSMRNPFFLDMGHSKESMMFLEDTMFFLDEFLQRVIKSKE